jgi:predicted amidophosphoribosyltransferase
MALPASAPSQPSGMDTSTPPLCADCPEPAAPGHKRCPVCLERVRTASRAWYQRNRDRKVAQVMAWKAANPEKVLAAKARWRAKKKAV